jgi:hypothetical protein
MERPMPPTSSEALATNRGRYSASVSSTLLGFFVFTEDGRRLGDEE